jgi:hypothetical protein
VRRVLLVLAVALVMAVMMLAMAMPVFAQAADPCTTGDTPSSPPDAGGAPSNPTPDSPPGYTVRNLDAGTHGQGRGPFTGPTDKCDQSP